eukprot:sb/3469976/
MNYTLGRNKKIIIFVISKSVLPCMNTKEGARRLCVSNVQEGVREAFQVSRKLIGRRKDISKGGIGECPYVTSESECEAIVVDCEMTVVESTLRHMEFMVREELHDTGFPQIQRTTACYTCYCRKPWKRKGNILVGFRKNFKYRSRNQSGKYLMETDGPAGGLEKRKRTEGARRLYVSSVQEGVRAAFHASRQLIEEKISVREANQGLGYLLSEDG